MKCINICDKANLYKNEFSVYQKNTVLMTRRLSIRPSFFSIPFLPVPSNSFLISKVTSCDTSTTVSHPLFLPLSQPGCLMSEGLVIYRVTSRWRGMQAMGKETLRGHSNRKRSDVPYSHLATFWECKWGATVYIFLGDNCCAGILRDKNIVTQLWLLKLALCTSTFFSLVSLLVRADICILLNSSIQVWLL